MTRPRIIIVRKFKRSALLLASAKERAFRSSLFYTSILLNSHMRRFTLKKP